MPDNKVCSQCNKALAADAPDGLCAPCLMRAGLEHGNGHEEEKSKLPRSFGEYTLVREIGRGGNGKVYEARRPEPGAPVAVKIHFRAAGGDHERAERFQRELESAGLLEHAHIVPIIESGYAEGAAYHVMPYIRGLDLDKVIASRKRGRAARPATSTTEDRNGDGNSDSAAFAFCHEENSDYFRRVAVWFHQAADALGLLHERGVLHRDIKPSNLLIDTDGRLWLTDFGLAHVQDLLDLTPTGAVLGTARYMSPEQARGKQHYIDGRTDIFALGVTLYEALTLRPAFDADSAVGALLQIIQGQPVAPRRIDPAIPRDLETIFLKATAMDREDRYAAAGELAEDLKAFLEGREIRAQRPSWPDRIWRWARRHPLPVVALFLILVMAILALLANAERNAREQKRLARESMIQQEQRIRLTQHTDGWSGRAWSMGSGAAAIGVNDALEGEAAATLIGLDARKSKQIVMPAYAAAFDRSGTRLLIGGVNTKSVLWNRARERFEPLAADSPGAGPVAFRTDGTPVQFTLDGPAAWRSLRLVDLASKTSLAHFEVPAAREPEFPTTGVTPEMVLTPDAAVAALALPWSDGTGTVFVWDGASGALRHQIDERASALAVSPDGSLLATGDRDGRITVRDLTSGAVVAVLQAGRVMIQSLAFGRDARVAADAPRNSSVGWRLSSGDAGGTVVIWDIVARTPLTFCRGSHYDIYGVAFSPDGSTIASCGRVETRLWDVATGRLLLGMKTGDYLGRPTFSADGQALAVLSGSGSTHEKVVVWELENGRGIRTLSGLSSQVSKVIFSPDGKKAAALSHSWTVGIWDIPSGHLSRVLDVPRGRVADNAALAFSPDGREFAFCAGTEARLWDLVSGKEPCSWTLPPGMVDLLGFHPSGKLLLFRMEMKDEKLIPLVQVDPRDHPRVCRIRELHCPDQWKLLAEIDEFNAHVFLGVAPPNGSYFLAEGVHLDATGLRRSIRVFDGPSGTELKAITVNKSRQYAVLAADPTGRFAAVDIEDEGRTVLMKMPKLDDLRNLRRCPDSIGAGGARMLGLGDVSPAGYREFLELLDPQDGHTLVRLGVDTKISTFLHAFSIDGRYCAWGGTEGSVYFCDLSAVQSRLKSVGMGW